jgi:hypothetical protein
VVDAAWATVPNPRDVARRRTWASDRAAAARRSRPRDRGTRVVLGGRERGACRRLLRVSQVMAGARGSADPGEGTATHLSRRPAPDASMISGHRQTARDVNVVSPMSARLATSCALAFLIACSSRHADAAPRAAIPKSSPRRKAAVPPPRPVTRAPRPVAIAAPPPAPAPAPAPPPEPEPPPAPARASLLDSSPPDVDRASGPLP